MQMYTPAYSANAQEHPYFWQAPLHNSMYHFNLIKQSWKKEIYQKPLK